MNCFSSWTVTSFSISSGAVPRITRSRTLGMRCRAALARQRQVARAGRSARRREHHTAVRN
jgi:hypothetical protein